MVVLSFNTACDWCRLCVAKTLSKANFTPFRETKCFNLFLHRMEEIMSTYFVLNPKLTVLAYVNKNIDLQYGSIVHQIHPKICVGLFLCKRLRAKQ